MAIMEKFLLTNKIAVVTGSGRGIGRSIALSYAEAGANVVVAARRTEEINAVAAEIHEKGRKAIAVKTDFLEVSEIEDLADAAISEFGRVDIWVNNVGGAADRTLRTLIETPEEAWINQIDLNLKSAWAGARAANRIFSAQDGGVIINISSASADKPAPNGGPYSAAKRALDSLTLTLASELAPKIRVAGIASGPIPTEVVQDFMKLSEDELRESYKKIIPLGRIGEGEDIAAAAIYLASPAASWITGITIPVAGGL